MSATTEFSETTCKLRQKPKREFRVYSETCPKHVADTYRLMHSHQSLQFAKNRLEFWKKLDHGEMTIMEAIKKLNSLVDESDPDLDIPNSVHAFQTAEGIRQKHPDNKWFQLTGLIHDLGKVMALWGEPQWAVVGDTYPMGCRPADCVVFGLESFANNPDMNNKKLNTTLGIYQENCGLENVFMSWGHDEYMYQVLCSNTCNLPEEALYIVRFHSFYAWHTDKAYGYLCNSKDLEMLKWVQEFSKFDLYTKSLQVPNVEEVKPYYQSLIDEYLPGTLKW